jgi:capping protein alpha
VEPIEQKVVKEEPAADLVAKGEVEAYRAAIAKQIKEYVTAHYEDGSANPQSRSRGTAMVFASPQGQIAIVISFKNLNLNNFWSGGWQSEWTFSVSDKGKHKLEGRIRLNVHYFEDGNVQLNSTFNENAEVTVSDVETTAASVVKTISLLENEFQERLEKFYTQMHESTFKNMRRFLPKIQVKMDWRASIHAVIAEAHAK